MISVGSVVRQGGQLVPATYTNHGWWVDTCALGTEVIGPYCTFEEPLPGDAFDGWAQWSGTSFAAPKVAGAIAARMVADPGLTARAAAAALQHDPTAEYVPELGVFVDDPA